MIRGLLLRAAALLLGSAAAVCLGELALRLLRPAVITVPASDSVEFFAFDPELGWTNRPNGHGRMTFLPDFDHAIRINARGLRDRDIPYERSLSMRRVLCLGDSFTWGMGVEAEETWPKVLERTLPELESLNAGVNAWTTSQDLLWLRREGLKYRPDAVVLGFFMNDFQENLDGEAGIYQRPYFVLIHDSLVLRNVPVVQSASARAKPLMAWLDNHSFLFRLAMYGRDWVRLGFLEPTDLSPLRRHGLQARPPTSSSESPPARAVTKALLSGIRRVCDENHVLFVVLLIPTNRHVRPSLRGLPGAPSEIAAYEAARGICRELGVISVDPLDILGASEEHGALTYNPTDMHWNVNGHRLAGELVAKCLEPLLPPHGPRP